MGIGVLITTYMTDPVLFYSYVRTRNIHMDAPLSPTVEQSKRWKQKELFWFFLFISLHFKAKRWEPLQYKRSEKGKTKQFIKIYYHTKHATIWIAAGKITKRILNVVSLFYVIRIQCWNVYVLLSV